VEAGATPERDVLHGCIPRQECGGQRSGGRRGRKSKTTVHRSSRSERSNGRPDKTPSLPDDTKTVQAMSKLRSSRCALAELKLTL